MELLRHIEALEAVIAPDNLEALRRLRLLRRSARDQTHQHADLERYRELLARTVQITTDHGLEPVASSILDALMKIIGATRGFLGRVDGDEISFLYARDLDQRDVMDPASHVSSNLIRQTLREGFVVVADAQGDAPSDSITELQLQSVASFALEMGDQAGFIYLDNPDRKGLFDHAAVAAIQAWLPLFQNHLARAIDASEDHAAVIPGVLTRSEVLRSRLSELMRVAGFDVSVLLWGETGTGKSFIARKLHEASPRQEGPFDHENCAALPGELAESELFGVEAGAFTGAVQRRQGKFEAARGGTLFLDEIDLMPTDLQAKLLIAVQDRRITPLGGNQEVETDVRIIAAMSSDPERSIRENRLREELYYRLATIETCIPPLRERPQDIPLLARNALETARIQFNLPSLRLSAHALNQLVTHHWPGNVRELENALDRAALLSQDGEIEHLQIRSLRLTPDPPRRSASRVAPLDRPTKRRYRISEHEFLETWNTEHGDIARVAMSLGVSERTVFRLKGKHL